MATNNATNSSFTEIEVDFGTDESDEETFQITDANVKTTSSILVSMSGNSPSDGRDVDEIRSERMQLLADPGDGSFLLHMSPLEGTASGKFKVIYFVI